MRIENLVQESSRKANALSLAYGHLKFLENNTGTTFLGDSDFLVLNEEGVLSNNRHFTGYTRQEYQPNGDATTEGQSLLITGFLHMYEATQELVWLDKAKEYWQAYFDFFYDGQVVPEVAKPFFCNWIVNGKEPVLAHYPLNPIYPTHGGFKSVPLWFENGLTQIPSGAPFWGQYLDVVSYAHRGHVSWPAINASVQNIEDVVDWNIIYNQHRILTNNTPWETTKWIDWQGYLSKEYTVLWGSNNAATKHLIEWIITWSGEKISGDGEVLSTGHSSIDFGKVQLVESLTGCYLLNFSVKLPVADGGFLIERNKPWHNRPLNVPVPTVFISNAADAEQWFSEASYKLWQITGDLKYKKVFDCTIETCKMFSDIDRFDQFFRKSKEATTPWTDGISYDYSYPSTAIPEFTRDAEGYINIRQQVAAKQTLEQQSVWLRVNTSSSFIIELAGLSDDNSPVSVSCKLSLSPEKVEDSPLAQDYFAPISDLESLDIQSLEIPLSGFIKKKDAQGKEYLLMNPSMTSTYGGALESYPLYTDILTNRTGRVCRLEMDGDGGASIDLWPLEGGRAKVRKFTYRTGPDNFNLRIEDSDGWRWWWMLPATNGVWTTIDLSVGSLNFSGYQPNRGDRENPTTPNYVDSDYFTLLLDEAPIGPTGWIEWYCLNELPEQFQLESAYTLLFSITFESDAPFTAKLGDCKIKDYRADNVAYSPGVIPFSNNIDATSNLFDSWRGMPYPGYQYPWIWIVSGMDVHLNNMVDFLYDSQQVYFNQFGVLGPGAAAYYWNRWDNLAYGPADTFTFFHWGNGEPWAGYQPRAFYGAALALLTLKERNETVPTKLETYVLNWIQWLAQFQSANSGRNPTRFPATQLPSTDSTDFTGHMSGLWLAGACCLALAGYKQPAIKTVIDNTIAELEDNFKIVASNHPMNGSWSPAVRANSNNGMFYGFWAGELLRSLGLYLRYLDSLEEI